MQLNLLVLLYSTSSISYNTTDILQSQLQALVSGYVVTMPLCLGKKTDKITYSG